MTEFEEGGGGFGAIGDPAPGSVLTRKAPPRVVPHGTRVRLAIIAERDMRQRGRTKRRSDLMVEMARTTRLTAKGKREKVNTSSTGSQLAFTGDRAKASLWPSEAVKFVAG